MFSTIEVNRQSVIKIVQELLLDTDDRSAISPSLISEKIQIVLSLNTKWKEGFDEDAVIEELIRRFSIWIGKDIALVNNIGHVAWLTNERKDNWRYWQRYSEWQEKKLPWSAIEALNSSTDHILGLLEDPKREGYWDRRGLVVGHVQSGKTGNYTGLISKAADAGYKIIIVLAGLHNNLRSQTQMRLDEGFLGYETNASSENHKVIGVGEIDSDLSIRPNYATNRSDKGDFNSKSAKMGISPEQKPWLFVVKKNKTILERLHYWINNHVANTNDSESGRKIVTHLPLLIIDDESDHASVDTGEQYHDENGLPDLEHQPTAINKLIRKILHSFSRKAYVGYTATPFANIFIHNKGKTILEGADLFPSSFIINLSAPSNYIGPSKIFGTSQDNSLEALPLVRVVDDQCSKDGKSGWMPVGHRSTHVPISDTEFGLPKSILEAVNSFILTCCIRDLRGQVNSHSSMLVHVTRFNNVQKIVHSSIEYYIKNIRQRLNRKIGCEIFIKDINKLWISDFLPTSEFIKSTNLDSFTDAHISWEEIESKLLSVINSISVKMINGTAKDILDYVDSAEPLKVIAIGGDKLARGLTLEGLCVSYFLRASRMYDTLMQMGRWFGYRPGYLDLCRLYTTPELVEWFEHIADASEELRQEFDMMSASSATPEEYGLKVQSHPVLTVTSRLKMRAAKSIYLSFSGSVVETVTFSKKQEDISSNYNAFKYLCSELTKPSPIPDKSRMGSKETWKGCYWENIPSNTISNFLGAYKTHPDALKVHSSVLKEFIDSMAKLGELTHWTIAVIGGSGEEIRVPNTEFYVKKSIRNPREQTDLRYSIRRLLSPKDEAIDLDESSWIAALEATKAAWQGDSARTDKDIAPTVPNGPSIRKIKGFGTENINAKPDKGLLLIYLLDVSESKISSDSIPIVAFGISFPGSKSGNKVKYEINNVLWEQEYASY